MDTINDRLFEIAETLFNGNLSNFAEAIGTSKGNMSNYVRSKEVLGSKRLSEPGFSFLEKVVNSLDIDANWLITGRGEMKKKSVDPSLFNTELLTVCRALIANYQQRDEVMAQLISMVKQME